MLRSELSAGRFQQVSWVETTGSTNADLVERAPAEPVRPLALFADEQTAGRGRLDRRWEQSRGGGLMVSFYVPWTNALLGHLVPTALAVATVVVIEGLERPVGLKWPNDVVVGEAAGPALSGKKLGGMLSAAVLVDRKFAGVVVGLGCNVTWPPADSAELPDAAALAHLDGPDIERTALAASLVARFDEELTALEASGSQRLLERYRDRCVTIGQRVKVEVAGMTIEGLATDIDPSGALLLEVDGRQRKVDVGDVIHLRPTSR